MSSTAGLNHETCKQFVNEMWRTPGKILVDHDNRWEIAQKVRVDAVTSALNIHYCRMTGLLIEGVYTHWPVVNECDGDVTSTTSEVAWHEVSKGNVDALGSSAYDDVGMHPRLYFIVMVLGLVPASVAQANHCELLPSDAKLKLEQQFTDWRPKVLSDLSGYDKKLWLEMHPKECPGIAVGHFEQPDHVAYAVLLIPKSSHTANYKIIVLSKPVDEYAVRMLDHSEGST